MNPFNPFRPKAFPRPQETPAPITGAVVSAFRRAAFPFSPSSPRLSPSSPPPSPPPPPSSPSPSVTAPESAVGPARRFASSRPASPVSSTPEDNEVFRRRVAIQRASRVWSPLLAAWHRSSAATHGSWTLPELMREVRQAARTLIGGTGQSSLADQQTTLALQGMIATGIAADLSRRAGRDDPLPTSIVQDVVADLAALRDEPLAASLREPPAETVLTRGKTSMSLTLMDAAVRLLPALARHAGLATKATLDSVLLQVMDRAEIMADDVLRPEGNASPKARQSLVQSLLRREAELLAAAFETLPPAGPGTLARGATALEEALGLWRSWSAMAAESVLDQIARDEATDDPAPPSLRAVGP